MGTAESQLSGHIGDLFASSHTGAARILLDYVKENTGNYAALDMEHYWQESLAISEAIGIPRAEEVRGWLSSSQSASNPID